MEKGDIVQIIEEKHPWFPCLLIVDEVRSWGIQGYVIIPKSNDGNEPPSQAWTRLRFTQIEQVGRAAYFNKLTEEE